MFLITIDQVLQIILLHTLYYKIILISVSIITIAGVAGRNKTYTGDILSFTCSEWRTKYGVVEIMTLPRTERKTRAAMFYT